MLTTVAAIVLYLVWLLLAFGVRIAVSVRRTGETGVRMNAAKPGSAQWWGKILFGVVGVAGLASPVADLAGLPRFDLLRHPVVQAAGAVVAVLGIAGTLVAQLGMGDSWRIGVDESEHTALVTGGVFRVVRNPIFTAMVLTALGLTLMVPNVISVVGAVIMVATVELLVRAVEEPYLVRTHGEEYLRYAAAVGRFVPFVGRHGRRAGSPVTDERWPRTT